MKIYNTADKVIAVIMTAISLYCFWISLTYLDYEEITFNGVVLSIFLFFIMCAMGHETLNRLEG